MTNKWSEPYGCGDSLWSSTVAVNALYWKIQTVTKLLLSVHFHNEHLLQKKNKKKKLYIVILIAFPVIFNWNPINPLLALSFENIGIKNSAE